MYDDLPFWNDGSDSGSSVGGPGAAAVDLAAAGAAAIRQQMKDPGFQAWLQQQEQERAAREARAAKAARLQQSLAAAAPITERLRQQQQAAELAKLQSKLQQQPGMSRPLMRPSTTRRPEPGGDVGWEDDVISDPNDVRKSDIGLTPAQMAALLEELDSQAGGSNSSSSRRSIQAPVFTPKDGYSFSGQARATASRLAEAGSSGQLQRPVLVRPALKPTGTGGYRPSVL